MNRERVRDLYAYALAIAAGADEWTDRELGPIHLLKFAYLADLEWASRNDGETWTGIEWRFHHFGPWNTEAWQEIDQTARVIGADIRTYSHPQAEDDSLRYKLGRVDEKEFASRLPLAARLAVRNAVQRYGHDTYGLLHHVYATEPMVCAAPGEILDFTIVRQQRPRSTPPEPPQLSIKKKKKRKERMAELRQRLNAALDEKLEQESKSVERALAGGSKPPRYDDAYLRGIEWLDSLAGEGPPGEPLRVHVDDDVWHSATRGGVDVE